MSRFIYPRDLTQTQIHQTSFLKWMSSLLSLLWLLLVVVVDAHLFVKIHYFQKVFQLFTPQIRHVWISFNSQNDQWANAHLFVKNMKICMRPWIRRYMHPPMSQTHKTNKSNTMNTPNSKNNYWLFTLSPRPARNTQAPQRRAPGLLKYLMDKRVGSKHFHTCHGPRALACVTNACDQLFWPLNI